MKRFIYLIILIVSCTSVSAQKPNADSAVEKRAEDILSRMTLEEKIDMLGGYHSFSIKPLARLGIPEIRMADGPVGVRNYGKSTAYPASICLAASWDTDLARKTGASLAKEARSKNVHIMLGPGMNIYRAAMGGRNFEYLGEDPFLAGEMAAGYIKGVQGEGVMAVAKHYAANNQEFDRNNVSSDMDERTLQEIYLPAFKASVLKGNVASVMTSYNLINGVHASQHHHLVNEILKDDWGFQGFVMSDWVSTYNTVGAANGGLDLEMPSGEHFNRDSLLLAIQSGKVAEAAINDKVKRMLRMIIGFGFLEHPDLSKDYKADLRACSDIALEAARGGIVLLKNDHMLPINKSTVKSIAVIGPNCHPAVTGGGGSSLVSPLSATSVYEGLQKVAGNNVKVSFSSGPTDELPLSFFSKDPGFYHIENGKPVKWLKSLFYSGTAFEGSPIYEGSDEVINYEWPYNAEIHPNVKSKSISVRWSGKIKPEQNGSYVFAVSGDDGYRLFINNELIFSSWRDQGEFLTEKAVSLKAGQEYDIKLDFYQGGGDAVVRFSYGMDPRGEGKEGIALAQKSDVAVVCLGFNASSEKEGTDRSYGLSERQLKFLKNVYAVNSNTIVILFAGGNADIASWLNYSKALIHAWYPGQEGGQALAEVIFGNVNPSGKLPISIEKKWEESPVYKSYLDDDENRHVEYSEGVLLGYRYFDTKKVAPLYPFGYGLSYTSFAYSNLRLSKATITGNEPLEITVDITNTGKIDGSEVFQLYVRDVRASLTRPYKELKAFAKVYVKVGETKSVKLTLDKSAFSFFNPQENKWVAEPGEFEVLVGSSSQDIRVKKVFNFKE